jgi:sortase A
MNDQDQQNSNHSFPKMSLPDNTGKSTHDDNIALDQNLAANVIREKLKNIYGVGPTAKQELAEIQTNQNNLSKHQKFIKDLQSSGKSVAEIQTEWHEYYVNLPDNEKHHVWEEFYSANKHKSTISKHVQPNYVSSIDIQDSHSGAKVIGQQFSKKADHVTEKDHRTSAQIKNELLVKVDNRSRESWYLKFRSLLFGLSVGAVVMLLFLFSFFNDRFLAPFITPSRNVSAQSLIVDPNGQAVGPNPLIIIPKINVEIPVIYNVSTIDENQIENNLQDGVVHYPTTAYPGQNGNGAIFGHSSNNILNPGKYKFAFVLLHTIQVGDTFTLDYQGKAYVYQIFQKQVVSPSDVGVLNNVPGHTSTFTLITCDPPGTSINRLVVVGDQISPSTTNNTSGPNQNIAPKPTTLPSNSTSLWKRFTSWL